MPRLWPYLLLLLPAIPLARDDFRTRRVGVLWLALLAVSSAGVGWHAAGLRTMLLHAAANVCVLLLFGCAMLVYHLSRRMRSRDFFSRSFGAGDAVMMSAVAPLFAPVAYVRFLLLSCLLALGWWCVKRPATIPLAGFMALVLAVYVVCKTAGLWM